MAFPTTYAGWISYIRDWLSVDEYSDAQIGSFLDLAQNRLNRELSAYGMEADTSIVVATPTPINILNAVPDFNKVRLVSIPGTGPLDVLAINEMKAKLEDDPDNSCGPQGYCIDAGKLYIYPAMSSGNIDFFYYIKVPALSVNPVVNSNVFTTDHPDALLFAALLEAAPYVKDEETIPIWESKYTVALSTGISTANRIKMGSTPLKREIRVS